MKEMDLYSFVYRGVLTEEALDRTGRRRKSHFGAQDARDLQKSLSFDFWSPLCWQRDNGCPLFTRQFTPLRMLSARRSPRR